MKTLKTATDAYLISDEGKLCVGYSLRKANLDYNCIVPNDSEANMLFNAMKGSLPFFQANNLKNGIRIENGVKGGKDINEYTSVEQVHYNNVLMLRKFAQRFMEGEKEINFTKKYLLADQCR